ncbi:hypothetical protein BASA81_000201 [Batrachochytrium salamandrivorans]|nr:hypothetical protein BASA81_000201 [Batrachochytrium salamandrivorans]
MSMPNELFAMGAATIAAMARKLSNKSEVENAKAAENSLIVERDNLIAKNDDLIAKNDDLNAKLTAMMHNEKKNFDKNGTNQRTIQELQEGVDTLRKQVDQLENENVSLKQSALECAQNKTELNDLKVQVGDLTKRLATSTEQEAYLGKNLEIARNKALAASQESEAAKTEALSSEQTAANFRRESDISKQKALQCENNYKLLQQENDKLRMELQSEEGRKNKRLAEQAEVVNQKRVQMTPTYPAVVEAPSPSTSRTMNQPVAVRSKPTIATTTTTQNNSPPIASKPDPADIIVLTDTQEDEE